MTQGPYLGSLEPVFTVIDCLAFVNFHTEFMKFAVATGRGGKGT
jgi:hypothetical protein